MKAYEIPGAMVGEWDDEVKAIVDTWTTYTVTASQFREAIIQKGIAKAVANGGRAWVMDASKAEGAFPPEVQKLIETEVFKKFASIGIKYFVTIKSASATTNLSIKSYTAHLGPCGIQMVEVPDLGKAIAWPRERS